MKSLYGLRVAPSLWSGHFGEVLLSLGVLRSKLDSSVFYMGNGKNQLLAVVHVDDLLVIGPKKSRDWLISELNQRFDLKHVKYLEKSGDQAKLLGRTLSKTEKGFVLISSPEYAEELAKHFDLDMDKSKPVAAPMSPSEVKKNDQKLDDYKKSQLRAVVGKLLWLAQDRPDLKYSVARLSTEVSDPRESTWDMAKKVVRYLVGAPLGMISFEPKDTESIELYIPKNSNQFHFKDGWDPEISDL